jgi:UDP-2-acetamido-2-deoxy-ribo-hexuluronate aminotransferase
LDAALLERAITPRTKAIMPVSLYGQCAEFDAINAIARKHNVPVIEDAAQSFGATYKGKRSCALSEIGSTSFFPSKPLGAYGDGGALFTNDDALARLMREIRVHGQDRRYHHPRLGVNGRLDTMQAAILLAKLEIFDEEVSARARIGARYTELLRDALRNSKSASHITLPYIEPYNLSVYAQYTIEVPNREAFEQAMKARGIPTAVHYPMSLHEQPVFAHLPYKKGDFPASERAAARVISLPMHPYLAEETQQQIVKAVAESVSAC